MALCQKNLNILLNVPEWYILFKFVFFMHFTKFSLSSRFYAFCKTLGRSPLVSSPLRGKGKVKILMGMACSCLGSSKTPTWTCAQTSSRGVSL